MCQIKPGRLWWSYIMVKIPLKPSFHVIHTSRFPYMSTNIQVHFQPSQHSSCPQWNLLWVRVWGEGGMAKRTDNLLFCITRHLSCYVALLQGPCWGGTLTLRPGGPTPHNPTPWSSLNLPYCWPVLQMSAENAGRQIHSEKWKFLRPSAE